jgi:Lar family restriction alleviation protein
VFAITTTVHACPFCGSRSLVGLTVVTGISLVQCGVCGAQGPARTTPEEAIARWDRRDVPEPALCYWCEEGFQPLDADEQYCSPLCRDTAAMARKRPARGVRHRTLRAFRRKTSYMY